MSRAMSYDAMNAVTCRVSMPYFVSHRAPTLDGVQTSEGPDGLSLNLDRVYIPVFDACLSF